MKKLSLIPFFSFVVILILTGCNKSDILDIKKTNFTDQIDQFQNLEFTFTQDVAPDSLLQKWDSTVFVSFDPPIKGRFKWTGQRDLVFSPTGPFAPNTDYTATLTNDILKLSQIKYSFKDPVIHFHTPYLEMKGTYAYWTLDENTESDVEVHVIIGFNYPIEVQDVKKFIKLGINKKDIAYRIIPGDSNTEFELAVTPPKNVNFTSVTVTMGVGMRAIGSAKTTSAPVTLDVSVPPNDRLDITDITAEFEDGIGIITIVTSQPVLMKGVKSLVSVDPSVEFEIIQQKSGFSLKGEFGDGETYTITLHKGIKGAFGPQLEEDYTQSITFGSLDPYISFVDESGMYLTPEGQGNLGLRIINMPKVEVSVFRIFENNIQHFMRYGQDYEWYDDEEGYYSSGYQYQLDENYGKMISSRVYSTNALPKKGNLRLLHINSNDLEISDDRKGIYLVKAKSTEKEWLNDVQLLSYSDIGIIVKKGEDEIFIATRSIATAQPLEGVTISFYSSNNQVVHKLVTGRDGVAVFKDVEKTIPGFSISMVTARKGDDFNVLLFNRSEVDLTRFETGGKYTSGREYDAFIYSDRNLYRPGDSVFFNAIMRDFSMKPVTGFPVKFRIIGPDGKDFMKKKVNVSSTGSAALSVFIPEKAYTGSYTLEVLTVSDVLISSYHFKVEEFMPDRISVDLKSDKKDYFPGDVMKLTVTAMNLFGPPAAGRKVENELRITRKDFTPLAYRSKYNFSLSGKDDQSVLSVVNQTVTSDKGIAHQEFSLPAFTNAGIFRGKVYSTVFDENGRPVNRMLEFNIYTQKSFVGLSHLPYWLSSGRTVNFGMIALDEKEKAVASKARLEIIQSVWETVIERNYGRNSYRSQERQKVLLSQEVNIAPGGIQYSYTPHTPGTYKIRLSIPGSSSYVEESFYAYSWGSSDESTFRINKDGQTDITFDKEVYEPGQTAKILFKTPFPGDMLVTVEQNKVLEYYTLHADNNGAVMDLDVKDEFLPNVYITATLLRKATEGGIPLTVAHGFASMKVERKTNRLPVAITAPEQIRSGLTQLISVKTTPGAEVTLAVVDEGILQITDYKTPDPYEYFYAKRALEVSAYDLFDELFPELSGKGATGGDQAFDLGKRLNPLTAKRVKLLSLWSGRLTANDNGEVTFKAVIPKFSGAVRIMAAVHKNHQFGSGDKRMKIADPVTLSSSLPRFLSPGDQSIVYVTLSNTTAKPIEATLSVKATKPLTVGKTDKTKVTIPANSETRVSYTVTAANSMGIASVTFNAKTQNETFTEKTEMSVRPAVPLVKDAESGTLEAGKSITIKTPPIFAKTGASTRLLITDNPAAQFAKHLDELINYPYGCIEQTISAAFPQLYYKDLAEMLKKDNSRNSQVTTNVNEAIRKVVAYQQYNGGIITWPTYSEINWWNSAYAAHFLYEAQRTGYTVDKSVTDNLNRYLIEMTKQKGSTEYYFYNEKTHMTEKKELAKREIFYSLYVLALYGKQHLPTMNYYKARLEQLTPDSRYLLASAYRLTGDIKNYNAIIPKVYDFDPSGIMSGDSYASPVRDKAIALYTLVTVDPDNPQIALLARQLSDMISKNYWYSTQERVFAVLALGKMAKNTTPGNVNARITVNGKTTEYKGKSMMLDPGTGDAAITASGKGYLFWYRESEGIPASMTVKEEDRVLRVRRQIFTRTGTPVATTSFRQNDLLVVALYISTNDGSIVDNVVVTDLLPACFEIENSRLNSEREMDWIKNESVPQYKDIRDDRINFFTTASSQTRIFYYMVRVVNKGIFVHGPAGAEAMYNGQYFSYFGAQKIRVE